MRNGTKQNSKVFTTGSDNLESWEIVAKSSRQTLTASRQVPRLPDYPTNRVTDYPTTRLFHCRLKEVAEEQESRGAEEQPSSHKMKSLIIWVTQTRFGWTVSGSKTPRSNFPFSHFPRSTSSSSSSSSRSNNNDCIMSKVCGWRAVGWGWCHKQETTQANFIRSCR